MYTVHTHMFTTTAHTLAVKSKETLPQARTRMALEGIMLNEMSQTKAHVA